MNTSNLKLNDFKSFEDFLFTEEEQKLYGLKRFDKFIKNVDGPCYAVRIPFSESIETIEEFQLCHYLYWMCIAHTNCTIKPTISLQNGYLMLVASHCFACEFARGHNCRHCPIRVWREGKSCARGITDYVMWLYSTGSLSRSYYAQNIARLEWSEVEEDCAKYE